MIQSMKPRYWRDETSGKLAVAIQSYLSGADLDERQISWIRVYLRQWIDAPVWDCDCESVILASLRSAVSLLTSQAKISLWLHRALEIGIDPLVRRG